MTHVQTLCLNRTKNNKRDITVNSLQGEAEYPGDYDTIGFNYFLLLISNSNSLLVRLREFFLTSAVLFFLANCEIID